MSHNNNPSNIGFLDIIWIYKFQLLGYIFVVSFLSFIALYMVGGIPQELKMNGTPAAETLTADQSTTTSSHVQPIVRPAPLSLLQPTTGTIGATATRGELPTRVVIEKIGVNTSIHNPSSTDINTLNNELLKGGVRYPGSGTLGQGNMFLFGHSTSLKIVNNQAFKAFNGVKGLTIGDTISVFSLTKVYTYKVTSISLVDSDEQFIDLKTNKNMLTISTCNVLGEKEERFVVEALFVKSATI